MNAIPGNSPPNAKKAKNEPTTGIAWMIACAIRIPVPERRSSGSE